MDNRQYFEKPSTEEKQLVEATIRSMVRENKIQLPGAEQASILEETLDTVRQIKPTQESKLPFLWRLVAMLNLFIAGALFQAAGEHVYWALILFFGTLAVGCSVVLPLMNPRRRALPLVFASLIVWALITGLVCIVWWLGDRR